MEEEAVAPEDIWAGDLFDRRSEADMLLAYIEGVWQRPIVREDKRAYTIAVDSGYGEGKSFFLRRLAKHLALNHPVAFVDAWADDIADEPLTALAATLKKALQPLFKKSASVESKWQSVLEKTGKVALIASKGLLRKGISLAITSVGLEAIDAVFDGSAEAAREGAQETIKDLGKELPDDAAGLQDVIAPQSLMGRRIAEFENGAAAVQELKDSLGALVAAIESLDKYPPIVIIIDELDRCRPTYSVKLMEEIKHLFDVPGIVFIFGMHGNQLANSMSSAYGEKFDGPSYLRRFISRRYTLAEPNLNPLIQALFDQSGLTPAQFSRVHVKERIGTIRDIDTVEAIARYMRLYGLAARDTFGVIDIIQTCSAITRGGELVSEYILPLVMSAHLGGDSGNLIDPRNDSDWQINIPSYAFNAEEHSVHPMQFAANIQRTSKYDMQTLIRLVNENDAPARWILDVTSNGKLQRSPYLHPNKYPDLLRLVGRFDNSQPNES